MLSRALCCLVLLSGTLARAEEGSAAAPPKAEAPKPAGTADHPDTGDADNIRLGELSSLGASKLTSHDTRIGVSAGLAKIGDVYYMAGSLDLDFAIKRLAIGISTPVNIPIYDPARGVKLFPDGIHLRKQDYANMESFARMIRYFTYGVKEGRVYLNFSTQSQETIGHGGAVRDYVASIDINQPKLSGELDAKFKYGGFEAFVGDVLHADQMLGALVYLKPFGGAQNIMAQRLSLGLTYAGDLAAPISLARDINGIPTTTGGNSPELIPQDTRQVHIVGASLETKVLRTYNSDIKPYINWNQIVVTGGSEGTKKEGYGLALGALGRFGFGEKGRHALRLIVEGRAFQNNYIPEYFDTFYQVQRYQYFGSGDNPTNAPTKLAFLEGQDSAMKFGYYAELQYALADWFAITGAYEDSNQTDPHGNKIGRNVVLHLEVPTTEYLRFFGTVYYRGINNVGETLSNFGPELKASNTIYFAGARVKLLPILFVNLGAFQCWELDQNNTNNSYRNVSGFQISAELGYEFSRGTYVQQ